MSTKGQGIRSGGKAMPDPGGKLEKSVPKRSSTNILGGLQKRETGGDQMVDLGLRTRPQPRGWGLENRKKRTMERRPISKFSQGESLSRCFEHSVKFLYGPRGKGEKIRTGGSFKETEKRLSLDREEGKQKVLCFG